MLGDLYNTVSLFFSQRWPRAEGVITAVDRGGDGRVMVAYEFSVDGDGPYTGESAWFGSTVFVDTLVGQTITVRYRKSDPSINRLDDRFQD
jgi:hypothetical protein